MGVVYEARHSVLDRPFAVKVLRPPVGRDPQATALLRREALAAAQLESEHIASVLDFGEDEEGSPYMVMELLRGIDLRALLKVEKRLLPHRAADLLAQACRGLERAHARGIVHRDIKPSNLFVCRGAEGLETVKVLDFGVAKLRERADSASLQSGARLLGTLHYMAPEQIRCASDVDARADVYSLGIVLYQSLSGRLPHRGDTPHEVMHQILYRRCEALSCACPELDPRLAAIVDRALAYDPAHRFSTAGELERALRERDQPQRLADTATRVTSSRVGPPTRARGWWFAVGPFLLASGVLAAVFLVPRMHSTVEPAARPSADTAAREGPSADEPNEPRGVAPVSSRVTEPRPSPAASAIAARLQAPSAAPRPPVRFEPPRPRPEQATISPKPVVFDTNNPYR